MAPSWTTFTFTYLLAFAHLLHRVHPSATVREAKYGRASQCPGLVLAQGLREQTLAVRSRLGCLAACLESASCVSVVHEPDLGQCHLGSSPADYDCANMEPAGPGARHYEQEVELPANGCFNGGTPTEGWCTCAEPYYGAFCEKILRDCSDVEVTSGQGSTWITHVILPSSAPVPFAVRCNEQYRQTFVVHRHVGQENFSRRWQDYVDGFGDMENSLDFWMGLDRLHQITSHPGKSYVLDFRVKLTNGSVVDTQDYPDFRVGGPESGYSFTIGQAAGQDWINLKDCLAPQAGVPFSTYDNDHDGSAADNCASVFGAGWWYSGASCSDVLCSPLGLLLASGRAVQWSGKKLDAFWAGKYSGEIVAVAQITGRLTSP